jgi:hypothetical protein
LNSKPALFYQNKYSSNFFWFPSIFPTALFLAILIPFFSVPLYGDEAASFLINFGYSWKTLLFSYPDPTNHAFFVILSKFFLATFGENEFSFRLPVLAAGVISILLIYQVAFWLLNSIPQALTASFLLTLSYPHLYYATYGRGHGISLTIGLVITLVTFKLLNGQRTLFHKLSLVLWGFCFVLTVPSNVHFLASIGAFFLFQTLWNNKPNPKSIKNIFPNLIPFLILLGFVLAYFLIIFKDLQLGVASIEKYNNIFHHAGSLTITIPRTRDIIVYLVSPWGIWFYAFVLAGIAGLRTEKSILIFYFCLIFFPFCLIFFSDVMGPPRVYLYWLPFVLILATRGIFKTVEFLNRFIPMVGRLTFVILAITLSIQPISTFKKHYVLQAGGETTSISDAIKTLDYVKKNSTEYDLIVVSYEDRILRRYLGNEVSRRMLNIFKKNHFEKITVIGHNHVSPNDVLEMGGWGHPQSPLHLERFQLVKKEGQIRIYDYPLRAINFLPPSKDEDYENKLNLANNPNLIMDGKSFKPKNINKVLKFIDLEKPRALGNKSLLIEKQKEFEEKDISVLAHNLKAFEITSEENYFLLVFARKYKRTGGSFANITTLGKGYKSPIFLNPYLGVFREHNEKFTWVRIHPFSNYLVNLKEQQTDNSDFFWQIIFALTPLNRGKNILIENFHLEEKTSYFDGFQSFLLY